MKKTLLFAALATLTASVVFGGTITVTQPVGGSFAMGAACPIHWTARGIMKVNIQLVKPGGAPVALLISGLASTSSPWPWTIASPAVAGASYKIRVSAGDGSVIGESAAFAVTAGAGPIPTLTLTKPSGGELLLGSTTPITWTAANVPANCRLVLLKDELVLGTIRDPFAAGQGGGSWNWKAGDYPGGPAAAAGGYKIRIETVDGQASAKSANPFAIAPLPKAIHYYPELQVKPDLRMLETNKLLPDLRLYVLKVFKTNDPNNTNNFFVNDNIIIRAEVENIGDTESKQTSVRIKIVKGQPSGSPWTMPGPTYDIKIPALNPKTRADAIATHTFTEEGIFASLAQVDPEIKIAEKDEGNNGTSGDISVTNIIIKKNSVDLRPEISVPYYVIWLETTHFEVKVFNAGTLPSQACRMRVEFTPNDKTYVNVPIINSGSGPFTVTVTHRYQGAGHKTVRAVVDPDRINTKESNWDNNETDIKINVHLN